MALPEPAPVLCELSLLAACRVASRYLPAALVLQQDKPCCMHMFVAFFCTAPLPRASTGMLGALQGVPCTRADA